MNTTIRQVLEENAKLPVEVGSLSDDANLYEAGLTSHSSVNVMLALEDAFNVEFPDELLRKSTFESIASIQLALAGLGAVTTQA